VESRDISEVKWRGVSGLWQKGDIEKRLNIDGFTDRMVLGGTT
jgi:hypothetical protein